MYANALCKVSYNKPYTMAVGYQGVACLVT